MEAAYLWVLGTHHAKSMIAENRTANKRTRRGGHRKSPSRLIASTTMPWSVGDSVAVWWAGDERTYPGTITAVNNADGTVAVQYEDGEEEKEVDIIALREPAQHDQIATKAVSFSMHRHGTQSSTLAAPGGARVR